MRADLSFLTVVADGPDDYVIGNGETFVNVPGVAAAVIASLDGTRTAEEARARVLAEHGVDVDVAEFVTGLEGAGLLSRPRRPPNLWDRIRPRHVAWLFSRTAHAVLALLTAAAPAAAVARPEILPGFSSLVWSNSLTFTVAFVAGSWILVLVHELGHVAAARSLNVRAELSLGTRLQFLVVQTRITGIWGVPRRARYRAYLAGMRVDWFLVCAGACVLYVADLAIVRLVMVICLSQIAWQFLFFMRTDVYYAFANASGNKNLMADAQAYLRAALAGNAGQARRSVRVYAWFLVAGRVLGLGFFALYTVPITLAVVRRSVAELPGWQPVATLALVAAGWVLYLALLGRRLITSARSGALRRSRPGS
ncbi:PqqD family protein [Nonomuraea sp. CA-141351]|uniref:PqqD family protein n=1 Tax=Nonomuraea sp. CA-141351 TaxID=3239996 RepID=UPI003D8DD4AF